MKAVNTMKTVLSLSLLLALSATVKADPRFSGKANEAQVDACVAAVTDDADLSDARRVRHDIETLDRRSIGYKLVIDTTIFGDAGVLREYRAVCVVSYRDAPYSFEMREVTSR